MKKIYDSKNDIIVKPFAPNLGAIITGIDLSNSMLEQARTKDVYDKLIHGDISKHLAELDLNFDYFILNSKFT